MIMKIFTNSRKRMDDGNAYILQMLGGANAIMIGNVIEEQFKTANVV